MVGLLFQYRVIQEELLKMPSRLRLIVLTLPLLSACVSTNPKITYSPEELREALGTRLGPERGVLVEVPFQIGEEIKKFAAAEIPGALGDRGKLEVLARAFQDSTKLGLVYDRTRTLTAEELFRQRRGDCLSMANLYIGLSREAGLDTFFIEANELGEYGQESGLTVEYRHICVGFGRGTNTTILDFDRLVTGMVNYRALSDLQAMARFYNTRGYQLMRAEKLDEAIQNFELATLLDPDFAWAYNNLGVAVGRKGDHERAENLYRTAVRKDLRYVAAYNNLAALLRRLGENEEAERLEHTAARLRSNNPYPHLYRGMALLEQNDPEAAIEELRRAVGMDGRLVAARLGLAQAYLALGQTDRALSQLDRAIALDPSNQGAIDLRDKLQNALPQEEPR